MADFTPILISAPQDPENRLRTLAASIHARYKPANQIWKSRMGWTEEQLKRKWLVSRVRDAVRNGTITKEEEPSLLRLVLERV